MKLDKCFKKINENHNIIEKKKVYTKRTKKGKSVLKGVLTAEGIGGNGWDAINVEDCV